MRVTRTGSVDDELLGVTIRLIEEFPEIAAGSVMRLVGRVVRSERWTGVPPDLLARETERTARILLARRSLPAVEPALAGPPEVEPG
ncbi:MAG: hypothetical protein WB797_00385 [Nocardioides sp.]